MADEHWKKSNIVFGSAGMAASGMMPEQEEKPKPEVKAKFSDPDYQPEPNPEDDDGALEFPATPESIAAAAAAVEAEMAVAEAPKPLPTPAKATPVVVKPSLPGYGINSKAQGLYTDLKVAVIGNGSREVAEYNWDLAFKEIQGLVVSGISNSDEIGLAEMAAIHQSSGGFADYRELLARTKPNLAVIAEADTADKYEMIKNCLMSGAHVICPAPFTRSLEDADELIALADRRGLKLAVAYPMRLDPNLVRFHREVDSTIGHLAEIRIYGEMDEQSGGYDLLMRGGPMFDIMRMFAGDPVWCSAMISTKGKKSTRDDITSDSALGPLVGDTVNAQIYTSRDIMVNFVSDPRMSEVVGGWGMDFVGSTNVMRLYGGDQPALSLRENPASRTPDAVEQWGYWPELRDPYFVEVDGLFASEAAHRLVIGDWLAAITEDRKAECSAAKATEALEICHAIFQSAMTNRKIYFPMANRHHPLLPELRPQDFLKETA